MKYFAKPSPNESVFGLIYFLLQLLVIPGIIVVVNMLLPNPVPEAKVNVLMFAVNFVAVLLIFRKFLVDNFRAFTLNPWKILRCAGIGFLIYMAGNILFTYLTTIIDPTFININDATIMHDSILHYNFCLGLCR